VPVTVRDARSSTQDREWIRAVYRDYLSELSASKTGLFPALGEWDARESEFLAGWFALVSRPPAFPRTSVNYRMAEFFIVSAARRRGVGAFAASLLFNRFAGDWEVLEDEQNRPALQFWRRVIARHTSGQFSETRSGGEVRHRFRTEVHPSVRGAS
jgi:predicted acetyltransferase